VKLEGATGNTDLITHIVQSGVPVMGHLGLTPQSVHQLGGFKVQGLGLAGEELIHQAQALQDAGCFSIVLEAIPKNLAQTITQQVKIPTIGIGAGAGTDGQVLVLHDMLGLSPHKTPRFVRNYLDGYEHIKSAIENFDQDVKNKTFPRDEESYASD